MGAALSSAAPLLQDFVYAVDTNHRKERLLNGAALESVASRPALLITGASLENTCGSRSTPASVQSMHMHFWYLQYCFCSVELLTYCCYDPAVRAMLWQQHDHTKHMCRVFGV